MNHEIEVRKVEEEDWHICSQCEKNQADIVLGMYRLFFEAHLCRSCVDEIKRVLTESELL